MNRNQVNLLTTAHAVSAELKTILATHASPALQAADVALDDLRTAIAGAAETQGRPLRPRTRERNQHFEDAGRAAHLLARFVLGHARATRNIALAGEVRVPLSHFTAGRFVHRVRRMHELQTLLHTHASALVAVGVTPALIADFEAKLATAEAEIVVPRSNIATRRVATNDLADAFGKIEILLGTLDPLMEVIGATDPVAYSRYRDARRIIDLPGSPAVDPDAPPKVTTASHPAAAPLTSQPLAA